MGRSGFAEDHPEVAEWIGKFRLSSDDLHSLENVMFNEMGGEDNDAAVDTWLEDHPDVVSEITG